MPPTLLVSSSIFKAGSTDLFSVITSLSLNESESEVAQSCPALCDPTDCSPPSSSVRRILQARVLEWVAISFSRGSSQPRDRTQVSRIADRCFNLWATREALSFNKPKKVFWGFRWLDRAHPISRPAPSITAAETLVPRKESYSRAPGIRTQTSLGRYSVSHKETIKDTIEECQTVNQNVTLSFWISWRLLLSFLIFVIYCDFSSHSFSQTHIFLIPNYTSATLHSVL